MQDCICGTALALPDKVRSAIPVENCEEFDDTLVEDGRHWSSDSMYACIAQHIP